MKYCPNCGHLISQRIPQGDNRVRDICDCCHEVFYVSPKIVVSSIPVYDNRILLCRRAIEPRFGCWTLPGGYMEQEETMVEAAIRETREEACTEIIDPQLYFVADIPNASQVHVFYRARLLAPNFSPGDETSEIALFLEEDIPWWMLSFRTTFYALHYFFQDRRRGAFDCREISVPPVPNPHNGWR